MWYQKGHIVVPIQRATAQTYQILNTETCSVTTQQNMLRACLIATIVIYFHFLSFLFDSNVSMKPSLIGLYREKPPSSVGKLSLEIVEFHPDQLKLQVVASFICLIHFYKSLSMVSTLLRVYFGSKCLRV